MKEAFKTVIKKYSLNPNYSEWVGDLMAGNEETKPMIYEPRFTFVGEGEKPPLPKELGKTILTYASEHGQMLAWVVGDSMVDGVEDWELIAVLAAGIPLTSDEFFLV